MTSSQPTGGSTTPTGPKTDVGKPIPAGEPKKTDVGKPIPADEPKPTD